MEKLCFKCGEKYKLTGATIGLSDGSKFDFKALELAIKITDTEDNEFYIDLNLCPDCMEKMFYDVPVPDNAFDVFNKINKVMN